jgi:hypothetical protein
VASADRDRGASPVPYFIVGAVAALAVVVLLLRMRGTETPEVAVAPPPKPIAAQATPTPPAAPPIVAPASPSPAPEVTPPPAPPTGTQPPAAQPPSAVRAPTAPVPVAPKPGAEERPPAPAPTAPGSPWDAPAAAAIGKALITSHPSGARVRLDGKEKGTTPLEVSLPYGSYSVELDLDGFVPVRRRIDVQSAEPKFPNALDPVVRRGNVLVVFEGWDGSTLTIDGEIRGVLPATVSLSEGVHNFTVKGDRGEVRLHREVTLASSGLTKLLLHQ